MFFDLGEIRLCFNHLQHTRICAGYKINYGAIPELNVLTRRSRSTDPLASATTKASQLPPNNSVQAVARHDEENRKLILYHHPHRAKFVDTLGNQLINIAIF